MRFFKYFKMVVKVVTIILQVLVAIKGALETNHQVA